MKNSYVYRSRISAADLTALQAAREWPEPQSANRLYHGLHKRVLLICEDRRPLFGVVAVDESFFGAWLR